MNALLACQGEDRATIDQAAAVLRAWANWTEFVTRPDFVSRGLPECEIEGIGIIIGQLRDAADVLDYVRTNLPGGSDSEV